MKTRLFTFLFTALFLMLTACATPLAITGTPSKEDDTVNVYVNSKYGFNFALPMNWKGYTIVDEEWLGFDFEQIAEGPTVLIRNPNWTDDDPTLDILIMIFTYEQWESMLAGDYNIHSYPVSPEEVGRNSKYIFAIYGRFDFYDGSSEIRDVLNNNAFQATENISTEEAMDTTSLTLYTAQLTHNDDVQTIELDTSHVDSGWYVMSVKNTDGKTLWKTEAAFSHAGWNTVLLMHLNNRDYLMQYNPTTYQGYSSYNFRVFSLDNDGNEILWQDGSVEFTKNPPGGVGDFRNSDIDAIKSFFERVNYYLRVSELMLTTDEHIKELLPEDRRDRAYGTKDKPITTIALNDYFYERADIPIEEQIDRFIEMYTREYGVTVPNATDNEFQAFIEKWKLGGLITNSIAMTMEDKRQFTKYFQQFDNVSFNYVILLLQGIINGTVTVTNELDDHEHGVYLHGCELCLYDMNRDGTPELILRTGIDEAGYRFTVYTIADGKLVDCGSLFGGHASLLTDGSGDFVRYIAQMGTYEITMSTLEGTTLATRGIASGELDYSKNEEYPELSEFGYSDYNQWLDFNGIPELMLAPKS